MNRAIILGCLLVTGAVSIGARQAGQSPQPQTLHIEKVRDNLYVITGGGGNSAAFIMANGVLVVDAKNPGMGSQILERIKSVTDRPVTTLINTHTHRDHVGGNTDFSPSVDVVVQENTRANMERMEDFQGKNASFLPKRTFTNRLTLFSGADRVELFYFGRGHTNGDALVVFPAIRAMHSGDLFPGPTAPIMDAVNNGGSGLAYPETLKKAAAGITGVENVIPGHSAPTTWSAFVDYGEFIQALVSAAQLAHKEGRTVDEAVAALTLPEKFKGYNMGRARANIEVIYKELGAR